jgi:hypothetical protein
MGIISPLIGGIVGGIVGIFIWVEVGYLTHYEIGWIAWGVGGLVGLGVRYAAYMFEQEANTVLGFLSAGMAICSIFIAKYIVFVLFTNNLSSTLDNLVIPNEEQSFIAEIADQIIEQKTQAGATIQWPSEMNAEEASAKEDYPPQIWQEAEKKWNKLSASERDQRKQDLQNKLESIKESLRPNFSDTFRALDLLWFALATITAFKIGIGTYGTD